MSTTPNMSLQLPSPLVTTGPAWASELNDALEVVDSHDHSPGSGVQITPAGLNINDDLSLNDNGLLNVGLAKMTDLAAALAGGSTSVFVYNGELYYRDASSNNVQITLNGSVASAGSGAISGLVSPASASYSSITETFTWLADTGQAAKMASADLIVYEYGAVSPNPITVKSPSSVASAYSITLPDAVPASTLPVVMSSSGVLSTSGSLLFADGTAGAPSIAFGSDTDLGLYKSASGTMTFTDASTALLNISSTAVEAKAKMLVVNGSASAPSIAFTSDTNTGLYAFTADQLGVSIGGSLLALFASSGIYSNVSGTAALPAWSFIGDADNGMYKPGTNELGFSTGGTARLLLDSGGATIIGGASTTGNLSIGGTLDFADGTFKVSRRSGTIAISDTATISVSGTIYGWVGSEGGTSTPIGSSNSLRVGNLYASNYGSTSLRLNNTRDDASVAYNIVIIHA